MILLFSHIQSGSAGRLLPRGPGQPPGERHRQPQSASPGGAWLQGAVRQARRPHADGRRSRQDQAAHRPAAKVFTVITRKYRQTFIRKPTNIRVV